jgi:class 3 adenylate cyclase/tetratricopeptide (TPR) repeat protein
VPDAGAALSRKSEVQTIQNWLQQLGLSRYWATFAEHAIDFDVLPTLTDADLRELGLALGDRRRLLLAIPGLAAAIDSREPDSEFWTPAGERRQLTVMFCDVAGSTELATRLDPEQLRDLMQAYQRACAEVIARYEGHIAQYLGDGVMAYFGWPRAHEDDAIRAIQAALELVEAVSGLGFAEPIVVRVGIHTGLVVVGETGRGDASVPKTAVGDTPNIAARLQAIADPGSIVVSERTRVLARGLFEYGDLGVHTLKGLTHPLRVFRVLESPAIDSRFEAARRDTALTPLVGREEEVSLLLRRWQEAKEGDGQVVLLGGEPGVGKSRLTGEIRDRLIPQARTSMRYQCSPYHVHSALYPVIEHFERAAGFAREDSPDQKLDKLQAILAGTPAQIAESAPLLAAMLSLPVQRYAPLNLSPQKQKAKTLEALAGQVEILAGEGPVLMIWEDVHWIDATTQEGLDLLVPRLQRLPVLLIVTYRPEYTPKWVERPHVTLLGLGRLGRRQAAELVTQVTGAKALPGEVVEQIVARTDGVPLFVEELTKSILESNLVRETDDRYVLDSPMSSLAVPATLRDSLIARLDRLAPVREVAQIGACIGRDFNYQVLAGVSPLQGAKLDEALDQLTASGLLFRRGTPPQATYTFKHALVQDAAYDSLLKSRRAQLHAEIAKLLEKDFFDQIEHAPELLAHHYTQAGNASAAIPLWRQAGGLAARRVALQEAIGHFRKALALVASLPPSPERDRLELSVREPLNGTWIGLRGWPALEVGTNAGAILELAKREGRPQSLLIGLWGMWTHTLTQGRLAESLEWAQRLAPEADKTGNLDLQIFGHVVTMVSHLWLGQLVEAREHSRNVLALYDPQHAARWLQLTGQDLKTLTGVWSAHWTWMLGYPDQAVDVSNEKDAHARRVGHAFDLGWALTFGAFAFDYRCDPEELLKRVLEADRLARDQSIPILNLVMVPYVRGLAELRARQLPESIALLRRAIENWNRLGGHLGIPYAKAALAEALTHQGDPEAALQLIEESIGQIERPGWQERVHFAEILRLKGWMLSRVGREEEAELQLRASIDWARQQQARSWELRSSTTLAELLASRGKRDAARGLLEPIYNWFTEGFDTQDLQHARALLEQWSK